jgi:beta-galactosidase
MRAAGLKVVTTYVEWSLHNPKDDVYDWTGIADLENFIRLAALEDLLVILRPGPYICAERDMGGFPYWLLQKYPRILLRTYDQNYRYEVSKWYSQLMTKMEKHLYGNGGPIILVQVENEYGSFYACDEKYRLWLKDETLKYTQGQAVLFTNDGPSVLRCGKIPDVLATLDFGAADDRSIDSYWATLRRFEKNGPLMNAEYYPGWLTHWQEEMQRVPTEPILKSLEKMILDGANVNFYMFYGGTNFGFTAGANDGGPGNYNSDVTSYDYDAPMDEAGDPTEKYFAIRKLIGKYFPLPDIPVPEPTTKVKLPDVILKPQAVLLDSSGRRYIANYTKNSEKPMTFEALNQYSGFILYETKLPKVSRDPANLVIRDLRDRAYVYLNRQFVGVLSRENKIDSMPLSLTLGDELQILVENEGRINYGIANDFKGIVGSVTYNSMILLNWTMTGYPLDNYEKISDLITTLKKKYGNSQRSVSNKSYLRSGATIFHGEFTLNSSDIGDTYVDPSNWGKGIIFINGFNLGRYWPLVGPQITLYVPKEILREGTNKITLVELEKAPENGKIIFSNMANLDGN